MKKNLKYYLTNEKDKLRNKWKIIDYLEKENKSSEERLPADTFAISKLREMFK
jgi:hypothetical protein